MNDDDRGPGSREDEARAPHERGEETGLEGFDEFETLFADLHEPHGANGVPSEPLQPADSRLEVDVLIEEALRRHVLLFARRGDTWHGMPVAFGCRHAEVEVSRTGGHIDVTVDTGIRVPPNRRDEVNKLILLRNNGFCLSGFKPLGEQDDAILFAFGLSEDFVLHAPAAPPRPRTADLEPDDDETLEGIARLLRERESESGLSRCIALAMSTVKAFTPKFNAIAYGGRTALDLADD